MAKTSEWELVRLTQATSMLHGGGTGEVWSVRHDGVERYILRCDMDTQQAKDVERMMNSIRPQNVN